MGAVQHQYIIMEFFKKSWRRIKKVFGSKDKEKIFTWDLARFEAAMKEEEEMEETEEVLLATAVTKRNGWMFAVCDVDF